MFGCVSVGSNDYDPTRPISVLCWSNQANHSLHGGQYAEGVFYILAEGH